MCWKNLSVLAYTPKSCEISLSTGKKYIFYHFDYISKLLRPFFDPKNPQKWENVHISANGGPTKLSFERKHACLYTCFIQIISLKWTEVLQNFKNGKDRLNGEKWFQSLSHKSVILETLIVFIIKLRDQL